MALQTISRFQQTKVNLGKTDSALVTASGVIFSDTQGIVGGGSAHSVTVQGTVVGSVGAAISLGISSTQSFFEHVVIDPGGFVGNFTGGFGISILASASMIENHGAIFAPGGRGVGLEGNNGSSQSNLINTGSIKAGNFGIHRSGNETLVVTNSGTIEGGLFSFQDEGDGISQITNTGTMVGDIDLGGGDDVYTGTAGHLTGRVYGAEGNDRIEGGADDDVFLGGNGDDFLQGNAGTDLLVGDAGNDTLAGGSGNDTLVGQDGNDTLNGGLGADRLIGGLGQDRATYINATSGVRANLTTPSQNTGEAAGDTYNSIEYLTGSNFNDSLLATAGANRISGANGNDVINGMAGNDVIFGGSGNDRIYGHLGNDTLEGNAGNDTFIFHTALGASNVDTITDFNPATDSIELENAIFTALTTTGVLAASAFKDIATGVKDANDRIIYNSDTGILYYDRDGSGSAYGDVEFAVLTGEPTLTNADFFVI